MGRFWLAWLLTAGTAAIACGGPVERFQFTQTEMAVPIRLVFYATDADNANKAAKAVFDRFHRLNQLLSDYDPESELRRLCQTAGSGTSVPVSIELWTVLEEAQRIARGSDGAFDVTVGPLVRLWRRAKRQKELPPPDRLAAAKQSVGYHLLHLDPQQRSVRLEKSGMLLDLGGIAKGYAVDEGLAVLRRHGIARAMIYAGGDIGLGDPPPDKPGWTIGVGSLDAQGAPSQMLCLAGCAVATSGDMWQFVVIDGHRYSHIVDPRTGVGLQQHSTVTVVGPVGMTTDALTKAVCILEPPKGLKLIEETPGMAAQIRRQTPSGTIETFQSSRWSKLPSVPVAAKPR
jgi:FAD:protein FMN transferase